MKKTLRKQVGRLLIVGLEGTALTPVERAWLKWIQPCGVILFRRNIADAQQTFALLRETAEIVGAPIFGCVDLEGGLVDRLRDLIAPMPSPATVFHTGKPSWYKRHGRLIAKEVRLLGFNTVFAPVLDLALPASREVMRSRVVSSNPAQVTAYAKAFLEGFAAEGVVGCGKHFPGLGGGNLDSHLSMPVIHRSWGDIWQHDLAPFRSLTRQLPMVMVAHASYPEASGELLPASVSSFWITEVLRRRLRYAGLVISDDMEMGGILTQRSMEDAAVEAVRAGTDILEICKDPSLVLRAYEALLTEAERSKPFHRRIEQAIRRVDRLLRSQPLTRKMTAPTPSSVERMRSSVRSFLKQ